MDLFDKLDKLRTAMGKQDLDCVVIAPSGDLEFLIGFNPVGCERFQALFVPREQQMFYVVNRLYLEEMQAALPADTPFYVWDDAGNFHDAVQKAFGEHRLPWVSIGINDTVRGVDLLVLQSLFENCQFKPAAPAFSAVRIIKTREEIESLKTAALHADAVMEALQSFIRPGITEKNIKDEILRQFAEKNLSPSFSPIVASGSNNSRPHYNKEDRVIQEKDVIILDFGCKVNGFCSDTSRTYFVGQITPREKQIYAIVQRAFQAAAASVKEGVTAGEVDRNAREVIQKAGMGEYFINRTGHGIGMDVHEEPFIRGGSPEILKKGMAFSIEPGIYIPGEVGMRIEDIFIINENGQGESLNHSSKEVTVLSSGVSC